MISLERGRSATLMYILFMCRTTFLVYKNKGQKWSNFYSIFEVLQIFLPHFQRAVDPLNFTQIRSTFLRNLLKVLIFTAHKGLKNILHTIYLHM